MIDAEAQALFEAIRDVPYRLAEAPGELAANCYVKNTFLSGGLRELGYEIREVLTEMRWEDTKFPQNIADLWPKDVIATHFYLEIQENGVWRPLDASWDRDLASKNFDIPQFNGDNCPCIPALQLFTPQEHADYMATFADPAVLAAYMAQTLPFVKAANLWLAS